VRRRAPSSAYAAKGGDLLDIPRGDALTSEQGCSPISVGSAGKPVLFLSGRPVGGPHERVALGRVTGG